MKMTMHIKEELLGRVMAHLGIKNKTLAVELALKELERKAKMLAIGRKGLTLTAGELRTVFDPDYDLSALRSATRPVKRNGKTNSRR
jgi:Arc/MetJ family transcription regulator